MLILIKKYLRKKFCLNPFSRFCVQEEKMTLTLLNELIITHIYILSMFMNYCLIQTHNTSFANFDTRWRYKLWIIIICYPITKTGGIITRKTNRQISPSHTHTISLQYSFKHVSSRTSIPSLSQHAIS